MAGRTPGRPCGGPEVRKRFINCYEPGLRPDPSNVDLAAEPFVLKEPQQLSVGERRMPTNPKLDQVLDEPYLPPGSPTRKPKPRKHALPPGRPKGRLGGCVFFTYSAFHQPKHSPF